MEIKNFWKTYGFLIVMVVVLSSMFFVLSLGEKEAEIECKKTCEEIYKIEFIKYTEGGMFSDANCWCRDQKTNKSVQVG